MKVKVKLNGLRISPSKVRLVADLIRGCRVAEALVRLNSAAKRSAGPLEKLLLSGIAAAEHNFGLDKDNLYVYNVIVNEGMTMKRWLPRAHGRATKLLKRTSKVELTLAEVEEGKNRVVPPVKTKTENSAENKAVKEKDVEEKKTVSVAAETKLSAPNKSSKTALGNTRKMFRRKSG